MSTRPYVKSEPKLGHKVIAVKEYLTYDRPPIRKGMRGVVTRAPEHYGQGVISIEWENGVETQDIWNAETSESIRRLLKPKNNENTT